MPTLACAPVVCLIAESLNMHDMVDHMVDKATAKQPLELLHVD